MPLQALQFAWYQVAHRVIHNPLHLVDDDFSTGYEQAPGILPRRPVSNSKNGLQALQSHPWPLPERVVHRVIHR
jgi:hypothetical protein